jgi:hypothetical protein
MAVNHFPEKCENIFPHARELINQTREDKAVAGGGRKYWSDAARAVGIFEDKQSGMLRFLPVSKKNDKNGDNDKGVSKKQKRS